MSKVSIDVITAEFLYKALRPGYSWKTTAYQAHWEHEALKVRRALINHLQQHPHTDATPRTTAQH